jgi:D-alanyl-D-alanine carboxypeptidase
MRRGLVAACLVSGLALAGCASAPSPTPASVPGPSSVASAPPSVAPTAPPSTAASATTAPSAASPVPVDPSPSVTPAGTPPAAVGAALQAVLDAAVGTDVPGLIARVDAPGWRWTGAAGNAQVDPPVAADPAMHTRIASVSKMFTAVAVLRLAEEGRLSLDDPIDRWLPAAYLDRMKAKGFDPGRITVRHLLQHRSGIHDYDEMGVVVPAQMSQPGTPLSVDFAIFDGIDSGPADYPPGAGFEYSNPGYALLTRIIDAASGTTYEDYLRRTIIEPLGMTGTYLPTDPPMSTVPVPALRALIQETPGSGPWLDFTDMYVDWDRGSGDIISTVADLATFHRALREGRIIALAWFAQMRDFLPAEDRFTYGMGYQRVPSAALGVAFEGHNGGYPGAVTDVFYLPEADAYITIARNGNLVSVPVMRGLAAVLSNAR